MSTYGTGDLCTHEITSHDICAISAARYAHTFSAMREKSSNGNSLE
jgi:hypothetical protein